MAKRQHVIELNGQKYDALTGKIVTVVAHSDSSPTAAPKRNGKHVDGFVRRKNTASPAATAPNRGPAPHAPAAKVHKTTERSKTLMRTSVKKPVTHKIHAKAQVTKPVVTQAAAAPNTETIVPAINPGRIFRANHITQSNLIRKFSDKPLAAIKTAHLPVRPAPTDAPALQAVATPIGQPAPTTRNPFDTALELANSHFQPKVRKVRAHERLAKKLHVKPGIITASIAGLAVLVGGSYWAYQNVPNVAMRVATTKSGVSANLPDYQPSGFSLKGPIAAAPGQVSINYQSNSDDRAFQVVQRNTDWNSQSLLDNFVNHEQQQYQTMQVKGRTIYLYDSNATWVDGGVWYQIKGDATLSRDQMLRIVDGL